MSEFGNMACILSQWLIFQQALTQVEAGYLFPANIISLFYDYKKHFN